MSASLHSKASAEPNLTPILDMVFQLITFFMLVINFKAASMDLDLHLPVVGSARPVDTKGQEDLIILNVDKRGTLKVYGHPKDIDSYIASEAQASLLKARTYKADIKSGDELPGTVVLRADRDVPFKLLFRVISTCQAHGFRKFSLKAMNKEQ